MEDKLPVYRAAREYGVPLTTLRDRVDQRVSVDVTKSGPEPILSQLEEARLVSHIKDLATVGYGYTRAEVVAMATDYAVYAGKRTKDAKCLSMKWFYGFMGRWPELHVVKPSGLSEQRARCASEESITNYFTELKKIMDKYDLHSNPQRIYNIDEKGINTECKPPSVIAGRNYQPQVIMAERSKTVTVIGAGNAIGNQIPPYFVFPGQRMVPDLLVGKCAGAGGTMTPSGWSNSNVFKEYLQQHFMKYAQGRDPDDTLLILYDRHRSHVSIDLIDWAKENNIVLFVLPPHCSHILQPMDVGCFGPFQVIYGQECLAFSRAHHKTVTRYNVCELASKAYNLALSPSNLQSAFAKSGIFPMLDTSEMLLNLGPKIAPSSLYQRSDEIQTETATDHDKDLTSTAFFDKRGGEVNQKINRAKRRNISTVIGGKAITEDETVAKIQDYMNTSKAPKTNAKKPKPTQQEQNDLANVTTAKPKKSKKKTLPRSTSRNLPQAGPSHINLIPSTDESEEEDESESQIPSESKCCVCKRYYVQSRDLAQVAFISWAQCDVCGHWVHLSYCTSVRVVRRDTHFQCPCCPLE